MGGIFALRTEINAIWGSVEMFNWRRKVHLFHTTTTATKINGILIAERNFWKFNLRKL